MCEVMECEMVAQKVCNCYICGDTIKVGEKHNVLSVSNNVKHLHNECYDAMCDWGEEVGDDIMTPSDVVNLVHRKLRKLGIRPPKNHHEAIRKLYSQKAK